MAKTKKSTVKLIAVLTAAAAVLIAVTAVCLYFVNDYKNETQGHGREAQQITFRIESGDTLNSIGQRLENAGIIGNSLYFDIYLKLEGVSVPLRTGSYYLSPDMSYGKILEKLGGSPDFENVDTIRFTIPEGYRQKQIVELLASKTGRSEESFTEAIKNVRDEYAQLRNIPDRQYLLEGYLYPDTYDIFSDEEPESIIKRLVDNFFKKADELDISGRAAAKGYTLDEVLTLGSIIELETPAQEDLYGISGVLKNRIDIGMMLQADPTVIYAHYLVTGELLTKVLYEDLEIDSPYNTYKYEGLPPGPICNPRIETLDAALEPAESDYLFYINAGGNTYFAVTYEEHLDNIEKYLR